MIITADGKKRNDLQEEFVPVRIVESVGVDNAEGFMQVSLACVSFKTDGFTTFQKAGSYIVLDFGKEMCGGLRFVTRGVQGLSKWRLTFGESLTECLSSIGEKNATNDHAPRDFEVPISNMSDLYYGQTGFRFARVELLSDGPAILQNIFAVSILPEMEREAEIVTNDELLNDILKTAAYTLKLNFQKGYIWDGIKRDRLVWCGDLHPEIITSLYLFGDNDNIKNSLSFLRESASAYSWINNIPSYSAWWVINLCDYCEMTGNWEYFEQNRDYALGVIDHFYQCITKDGEMVIEGGFGMEYFLDWSTHETPDAKMGVYALLRIMAQKYSAIEENDKCVALMKALEKPLEVQTAVKPVRAFQVLAGRDCPKDDKAMLEQGGAKGFSTFMAYYILKAMAKTGSSDMLEVLKTYYGGMLSRGATSFWEDFDIDWLENSGRIDEIPAEGQKDIHGDFGKYCYQQFRHSLCHGWSSGVYAFIVEYILGVNIEDGGKKVSVHPHLMGLEKIDAKIPVKDGWLNISICGEDVKVSAPEGTEIIQ